MMTRQALLPGGSHPFGDPARQFLDGLAAYGKLDEMKRHGFFVSAVGGGWQILRENRSLRLIPKWIAVLRSEYAQIIGIAHRSIV